MKLGNTKLCSLLLHKLPNYRLDKLFIVFLLSLSIISCSGNGSSNGVNSSDNVECSDDFGDASRCEVRDNLE